MSLYYIAYLQNDDGTPEIAIDFGGSVSESATARLAVRLANRERRNTCVVERNSTTGAERVVQRIRFAGLAVPDPDPVLRETLPKLKGDRHYLSLVPLPLDAAILEFMAEKLANGYSVNISPSRVGDGLVNVVVVKYP